MCSPSPEYIRRRLQFQIRRYSKKSVSYREGEKRTRRFGKRIIGWKIQFKDFCHTTFDKVSYLCFLLPHLLLLNYIILLPTEEDCYYNQREVKKDLTALLHNLLDDFALRNRCYFYFFFSTFLGNYIKLEYIFLTAPNTQCLLQQVNIRTLLLKLLLFLCYQATHNDHLNSR